MMEIGCPHFRTLALNDAAASRQGVDASGAGAASLEVCAAGMSQARKGRGGMGDRRQRNTVRGGGRYGLPTGGSGRLQTQETFVCKDAFTASSIFWNVRSDGSDPFAMRCNVSGLTPASLASAPVSIPVMALAVASQLGSR